MYVILNGQCYLKESGILIFFVDIFIYIYKLFLEKYIYYPQITI
jgi:hypothetical protein